MTAERAGPTRPRRGILALILACSIWGFAPLYYKAMIHVPPLEMTAHRTVWSLVMLGLWLAAAGGLGDLRRLLTTRAIRPVALGAAMITVNWVLFIWAIQSGRAIEASLGYYLFPLAAVVCGLIFFGESLSRAQGLAIALASLAVAVLTAGQGALPWLALVLAVTFAIYGVVKKRLSAAPVATVAAEVVLMLPAALVWLALVAPGGSFGRDLSASLALVFSGVITALPLMLLSYASRHVSMAAYGLTQYLNPTLQFLCAALIFAEPVTRWHVLALALIWLAVGVFAWSALRRGQARPDEAPPA